MRGGEIFVPKIPSMKVVDVARNIAPELPHQIVGIRSGEKLHEIMITEDDARATLELPDRYIICPSTDDWCNQHLLELGGVPVSKDFRYASDTNKEWLEDTEFLKLAAQSV